MSLSVSSTVCEGFSRRTAAGSDGFGASQALHLRAAALFKSVHDGHAHLSSRAALRPGPPEDGVEEAAPPWPLPGPLGDALPPSCVRFAAHGWRDRAQWREPEVGDVH